jgi:hypothetical protein
MISSFYVGTSIVKAKFHQIFDLRTFCDTDISHEVTLDKLMKVTITSPANDCMPSPPSSLGNSPRMASPSPAATLTVFERQERLSILFMGLLVDTFAAVAKGAEFMVDDQGFPDLASVGNSGVAESSGDSLQQPMENGGSSSSGVLPDLRIARRVVSPCLAKETIWEGTAFAPMYGMFLLVTMCIRGWCI